VHAGSSASSLETRLLPLINERDVISMLHNNLATRLHATNSELARLERENKAANVQNQELAREMLDLANELKADKVEEVHDARLRGQLEKLDEDVRTARRDWRVLKSLVGGLVTGSGVDWASDPKLLELIMDEEDEMVA
jgi:hypothetical protein